MIPIGILGNAADFRHRVIGHWGSDRTVFSFPYQIFSIFASRVQFSFFREALKNVEKSTKNEESLSMSRTKGFGFQQAFHMSMGYEKDGFAFLTDGFEPSESNTLTIHAY